MALALGFSVFGCHTSTDIGLGLGGDDLINAIYTDTVSLGYSTVISDSAVNGNANYILSGNIVDPVFGKVEAVAYVQPSLIPLYNSSGIITNDAGAILYDTLKLSKSSPIIDSLRLRIYTDGLVYGDTNAISKFTVHRLTNILGKRNYNNDEKQTYDPTPLASFQFNLPQLRHDSTKVIGAYFVNLPKELAQELINTAVEANGNNETFLSKYRGFAIVPDKSNKAIYGFKTGQLDINNLLIPFWHFEGDTVSTAHAFNFSGPRYSNVTFDRSGTAVASLTKSKNELPISSTNNKLYLQGGSGIATKIDLSPLKNLGNIKIAKATIELRLDPSSINGLYYKTYYTTLAEVGTNNQQKRNGSNQLNYIYGPLSTELAGEIFTLVDSSNYLNVNITNYLQRQTFNGSLDKQLLLQSSILNSTTSLGTLANDNLSRLVFTRPRLILYYTKNRE